MSSLPGLHLEDFLAWQYSLVVEDSPESNISVGIAESLLNVRTRPRVTKEQFSKIVDLYEPYRESIEYRLGEFDEETQSWRGYAEFVDYEVPETVNQQAQLLYKEMGFR